MTLLGGVCIDVRKRDDSGEDVLVGKDVDVDGSVSKCDHKIGINVVSSKDGG